MQLCNFQTGVKKTDVFKRCTVCTWLLLTCLRFAVIIRHVCVLTRFQRQLPLHHLKQDAGRTTVVERIRFGFHAHVAA